VRKVKNGVVLIGVKLLIWLGDVRNLDVRVLSCPIWRLVLHYADELDNVVNWATPVHPIILDAFRTIPNDFISIIRNNRELDGRARFFITIYTETGGMQYFKITKSDTLANYFNAQGCGELSDVISIDIDINNDPNNYLETLARLSMTFQQGPNNGHFGLIMKPIDADLNDPAYFILNGDTFLYGNEIYSTSVSGGRARLYIPVEDLVLIGNVNPKDYNDIIEKNYFIYNLYLKYVKSLTWFKSN